MSLYSARPAMVPTSSQSLSTRRSSPSIDPQYQNRFSTRSNSHTSLLGPVLEDESDQSCGVRPTRRSVHPSSSSISMSRGNSTEEMGEWMVDVMAVQGGRGKWLERERVVLVLGECPPGALEPLISNSSFAHSIVVTTTTLKPANTYPTIHILASADLEDAVSEATSVSAAFRKKNKKKLRSSSSSSPPNPAPFDAVLHFLPSPLHFDPTLALQRMLREAIMATTVATASLASYTHSSRPIKKSKGDTSPTSDLAIPLVHVIPAGSPGALPVVIERYLLQLLPTLAAEPNSRIIRPLVLSSSTWHTRAVPFASHLPAIDSILFGGLNPVPGPTRTLISSWDRVVPSSSILASPVDANWGFDGDMDRRGSSASSTSSFGQHEVMTPSTGSCADMSDTIRPASLPPSRLSYVETFENEDEEVGMGETIGKKQGRGMFGWMKRRSSQRELGL